MIYVKTFDTLNSSIEHSLGKACSWINVKGKLHIIGHRPRTSILIPSMTCLSFFATWHAYLIKTSKMYCVIFFLPTPYLSLPTIIVKVRIQKIGIVFPCIWLLNTFQSVKKYIIRNFINIAKFTTWHFSLYFT